ncbi:SIMPL domain-containing protein [Nibribacter koreensis]|uniref:SIMPL domain-containing protein n=1 Tax=Nibribacter koreensis TaxID=1084519 RepID=A0ABP8FUB4_9BACT
MKKLLPLLSIALLSVLSLQSQAQNVLPPLVTVNGTGEVKVKPDQITFNVGVEVREKTLEEARKVADQRTAALIAYLKKSGIDEKQIQTAYLSLQPMYTGEYGQSTPQFYMATRTLSVTLKKLDKFDEVMAGTYKAGANRVDGIYYTSSQLLKHQEEARSKAVQQAKQKATQLAGDLGAKVGRVYNINEGGGQGPMPIYAKMGNQRMMAESMAGDASGTTLAAGEIIINASVEVSFLLE